MSENRFIPWQIFLVLLVLVLQVSSTYSADNAAITALDFTTNPSDELQIQLTITGAVVEPKVFHTDNPARIALDFPMTQNGLGKKVFPVDLGVLTNVYVIEAGDRVRVVINLAKSVPFTTKMVGNAVIVTIKNSNSVAPTRAMGVADSQDGNPNALGIIPKQSIEHLDFRRGTNGEGRLLVSLTNANTIVNTVEKENKVIITFLNTDLPIKLAKIMDVSDFATPVQLLDFQSSGANTNITITLVTSNYEYSSFQSGRLLTIEFRPLARTDLKAVKNNKPLYTGKRLSLYFQDITVRSVLKILADFTELNIIASDSVDGSVTLRLNDVPWDQVLDLVLKTKGLSKREVGDVILVAPTREINKIEKEQLAAQKIKQQLGTLRTEYITVNYAKAENFSKLIQGAASIGAGDGCSIVVAANDSGKVGAAPKRRGENVSDKLTLLSPRGAVAVDSRTNTLIVRDTEGNLGKIRSLLKLLDVPVRQVLIEARIVVATTDFAKEIGVRFGAANIGSNKTFVVGGRGTKSNLADGSSNRIIDLPIASSGGGALALTLIRTADYVLNLELSALQDEGRGQVLSNPRVLTSDRCEASIKQGSQVAFPSGDEQNRTVTLVDATLELKVTPQITSNGSILMDLLITDNSPGDLLGGNNVEQLSINTREIETSVRVDNGQTLVLGGIYQQNLVTNLNTVPFFADLPVIGFLFKREVNKDRKVELLIFITPKIVEDVMQI